jgi:hypothetical protein
MEVSGEDGQEEEYEEEDYRERMIALFVFVALGAGLLGMGLAFFLDWLQTTIL